MRVTLAGVYQIVDPVAAAHEVECWQSQVYVDLQLALREVVGELTFDELMDEKSSIGQKIHVLAAGQLTDYGVQLHQAGIKDITMPASIREMMLKTVEAEKSAKASLIKAR